MTTVNLLGPSRRSKDEAKGLHMMPYDTVVPGVGIKCELKELTSSDDFIDDSLVSWASKPLKQLVVSLSGVETYTFTLEGVGTLTFTNGLLTAFEPAERPRA